MPSTGLKPHSPDDTGIPFSLRAAGVSPFDWANLKTKNSYAPGKDQGQSASCTSQATGYGIFAALGIDVSREDMYANTKLPGGGAYLVSPWRWLVAHGYLKLGQHPDPSPETEANMGVEIPGVTDANRTKCVGTLNVFNNPTIDEVAQAIYDHDIAIIGITWTDEGFEKSWTEPTYLSMYSGADGHALYAMNPVVSPAGKHAIDCQSSWWNENGPDGKSTHHEIDEDFFANGGVFELLTIDINKKNMQLIKVNGTVYMETAAGITGIADQTSLAALFGSEPIAEVAALPSPELYTISQGLVINKK